MLEQLLIMAVGWSCWLLLAGVIWLSFRDGPDAPGAGGAIILLPFVVIIFGGMVSMTAAILWGWLETWWCGSREEL